MAWGNEGAIRATLPTGDMRSNIHLRDKYRSMIKSVEVFKLAKMEVMGKMEV